MTDIILPPTPLGPGEHTFVSGEGPCEATLVIKNPLSVAPNDAIGKSYMKVSFAPPGTFESTLSGGDCNDPQQPCEATLVVEMDIEREDGAQCVVGQPCPYL